MLTKQKQQRIIYQNSVHHRQMLRSHIDQNLIDRIEISETPSTNYQKRYQELYHDELERSVNLFDQKKNIQDLKKNYDVLIAGKNMRLGKNQQPFKNTISAICIPNLNYRDVQYKDYDLLKQTKALDYTLRNYDGGQRFFRNQDYHLLNQQNQLANMRTTLLKQLNAKEQEKQNEQIKRKQEQNALRNREEIERNYQSQLLMKAQHQKSQHRNIILSQMSEERTRRGKRTLFNYNSVARHNPITNPIEYHIDNPYILKQIQNRERSRS